MAAPKPIFTLTIPALDSHPGGTITLTTPSPGIHILTLSSPPDNPITTPLCTTLLAALDKFESLTPYPHGILILTSSTPKFFSNGLDLEHARANAPQFWTDALYPLFRRLLAFPVPTVAVLSGHAFAAGLMLGMMCDYRVANRERGYLCLNEVDFGALLKAPMSSIFREKVSPQAYRALVLEGRRFTGPDALDAGIVDALGGVEEAVRLAGERKLGGKSKAGVYGLMKEEMYRETIGYLAKEGFEREEARERELVRTDDKRREALEKAKL